MTLLESDSAYSLQALLIQGAPTEFGLSDVLGFHPRLPATVPTGGSDFRRRAARSSRSKQGSRRQTRGVKVTNHSDLTHDVPF